VALVESGLRDNGWPRRGNRSRSQDEQEWLRKVYEAARAEGWDTLSTKSEAEHGRQGKGEGRPKKADRLIHDPERIERELAAVRTESEPDSSVYVPRKPKEPVNTDSRRKALAYALTGKRRHG
jgi:hypothetical protein